MSAKSNRITKADMEQALAEYCERNNEVNGRSKANGLYIYEWGDHPVKFYLARDTTGKGTKLQVSPTCYRREMYEWLMRN